MTKNKIVCTGDAMELFMVTPIYKTKIKVVKIDGVKTNVESQVLVKELHTKKWIRKDAITSVEDYVTSKSVISKTRSVIFDKYSGKYFATAHSTDNIIEVLTNVKVREIGIGFNQNQQNHGKVYGKRS